MHFSEGIVKHTAPAGSLLHPVQSREAFVHCGVDTVLPAVKHHNQLPHVPFGLKTVWDMTLYFPTDAHLLFWQTQSHRVSQLLALKWGYFLVLHLDEWSVSWNGGRNSMGMRLHTFSTISHSESCILPSNIVDCTIQKESIQTSYCPRSWVQPILGDY